MKIWWVALVKVNVAPTKSYDLILGVRWEKEYYMTMARSWRNFRNWDTVHQTQVRALKYARGPKDTTAKSKKLILGNKVWKSLPGCL